MSVFDSCLPGVWYAHTIINMIAYLIYTVGFWRVRQPVYAYQVLAIASRILNQN
ncbi:MAG: hypothetical protein KF856_03920 [Cyclobacteriaceae bacterium]|nr:hypothetical protein [Cyclobacteriaceae bacterium]